MNSEQGYVQKSWEQRCLSSSVSSSATQAKASQQLTGQSPLWFLRVRDLHPWALVFDLHRRRGSDKLSIEESVAFYSL